MNIVVARHVVNNCAIYLRKIDKSIAEDFLIAVNVIAQHALFELRSKAGSVKSQAKTESCRLNGLKGGKPRKKWLKYLSVLWYCIFLID